MNKGRRLKRHHSFLLFISTIFTLLTFFSSTITIASETQNPSKPNSKSSSPISKISPDALVRQGKVAYRKKNYSEALEKWSLALKERPHDKEISKLVVMAQEKTNKPSPQNQEAIENPSSTTLNQTIPPHKKKAFVNNQLRIGKQAYRKKDFKAAYIALKKGAEVDPKNTEIQQLIHSIIEKTPNMEEVLINDAEEAKQKLKQEEEKQAQAKANRAASIASGENAFLPLNSSFETLPTEGTPLTLEQCIMIARGNSLSVKIAREEAALARWKMAPARRALWPSADVFYKSTSGTAGSDQNQDFEGTEYAFEFQKPLITWGKNKALFLQAKLNWEIAKRNLQKEVAELDFKVEQAYFILSNSFRDLQDLHLLYEETQKDLKVAEQRYKLELVRELEWLKAKSKVDEIYYRAQGAEKDYILAQLTLSQILDTRSSSAFSVQATLGTYDLEASLDQCVDLALKNRSDLVVNELLIEYNKLGQKIARSEYKWNVNLEGMVGMNDEAFLSETKELQNEYFFGVKVTKPFGPHTFEDNFVTENKVPSAGQITSTEFTSNTLKWYLWNNTSKISMKEADIKYLKAIDEYVKKRNSVIFEIKKAYYEYQKARHQLSNNVQKLKIAEQEVKVSVARLGLNEILDSELLETKDRLARTKAEYGQTLSGYYTAIANLNKAIGLTDYFDLKRGIQDNTEGTDAEAWKGFLNAPGEIGSLPNTSGYQLEGKKSWWQFWGNSSSNASAQPKTTQDLVEKTTDEGVNFYKQGKYPQAQAKFETALNLDSRHIKAQSYLRKTKLKMGQEVESFGPKLNVTPKTSEIDQWTQKGLKLYEQKQYEQAIQTWNKALELDPQNRRVQVYIRRAKNKIVK